MLVCYIFLICKHLSEIDTLSGEVTLSDLFYPPSEKGSPLKGQILLRSGANSFLLENLGAYSFLLEKTPFRVYPFQKGIGVQESKQEVTKVVSLVQNGRKSIKSVTSLN